jgi:periplasmic divalent cation tolerance protein
MAREATAIVVFVTCESSAEAGRIATWLIRKRLAACGNIVGAPVTSIYRWKGKIQKAKEVLLVLKSTRRAFAALEREVRRLHSYDVPEIIALPVAFGSQQYLSWIEESTTKGSKVSR